MMTAQIKNWKKKRIKKVDVFGIFESPLIQNPANQDSQFSWFFQTIW